MSSDDTEQLRRKMEAIESTLNQRYLMTGSLDLIPSLIAAMEYELAQCRARSVQLEAEIAALRGEKSGWEDLGSGHGDVK